MPGPVLRQRTDDCSVPRGDLARPFRRLQARNVKRAGPATLRLADRLAEFCDTVQAKAA
jgi:hypothetical protein